MTTEEIMRANNPRTLGEWAFQGFPGRRKREGRARALAAEGMQQRVAEEQAMQGIVAARAAEMFKMQQDAAERMATLRGLQGIRQGDYEQANALERMRLEAQLREPLQRAQIASLESNALANRDIAEANRAFRESQAADDTTRAWAALDRATSQKPKPEQNLKQVQMGDGSILETDLNTGAQFHIGPNLKTGALKRTPLKVPPLDPNAMGAGAPYLGPRADASTQAYPNPVRNGDEQAPAQKPGFFQRMFGGGAQQAPAPAAPRKTLVPGATGQTSQVQTGPNIGKDEAFQTNSLVAPTQQEALAEQPTVFANSYLPRFYRSIASQPGNMGGVQFVNPRSEEQIATDLYTANRQSMMPDAAYMRGTYTPGRSRRLDAALARPSRAFQYLQSLYQ